MAERSLKILRRLRFQAHPVTEKGPVEHRAFKENCKVEIRIRNYSVIQEPGPLP